MTKQYELRTKTKAQPGGGTHQPFSVREGIQGALDYGRFHLFAYELCYQLYALTKETAEKVI